jgi:uncharacterized protein YuzE
MKVKYDKKVDAMRITFQDGEYSVSKEIDEGFIVDMSSDGKVIALEILDVSEKMPPENFMNVSFGIND